MPKAKTKTKAKRPTKESAVKSEAFRKWRQRFEGAGLFIPSARATLVTDVWALSKSRHMEYKDLVWVTAELLWQIHVNSEEDMEALFDLQRLFVLARHNFGSKATAKQREDVGDEVLQRECRGACSKTAPIPPNP